MCLSAMDELRLSMSLRLLFHSGLPGVVALAITFLLGAATVVAYAMYMCRYSEQASRVEPIWVFDSPEPTRSVVTLLSRMSTRQRAKRAGTIRITSLRRRRTVAYNPPSIWGLWSCLCPACSQKSMSASTM